MIGLSVGLGAGCTVVLGALVDAHGLPAALWGCAGLALLALACAAAGLRQPGRGAEPAAVAAGSAGPA